MQSPSVESRKRSAQMQIEHEELLRDPARMQMPSGIWGNPSVTRGRSVVS
jgi:hypothetical protein